MMRYRILLLLAILLFLVPGVSASDIERANVTIDIVSEETARITYDIYFTKITTNKISQIVYADIVSVEGYDALGPINCVLSSRAYGTEVVCDPTISNIIEQNITMYPVRLELVARNILSERHPKEDVLSFTYPVTSPTKMLTVTTILPEGTVLLNTGDIKPYFPSNAEVKTTGRQVVLEWTIDKPALGDSYVFRAQFEALGNKLVRVTIMLASILVAIAVVGIGVFFFIRRKKRSGPLIKTVFSVLRADERKVLDVIVSHGGSCKQRDIVKKTDFSKAKVSRILTDLEKRGIVEKDRTGRTNKVAIKDPTQHLEKQDESKQEEKKDDEKPTFGT